MGLMCRGEAPVSTSRLRVATEYGAGNREYIPKFVHGAQRPVGRLAMVKGDGSTVAPTEGRSNLGKKSSAAKPQDGTQRERISLYIQRAGERRDVSGKLKHQETTRGMPFPDVGGWH